MAFLVEVIASIALLDLFQFSKGLPPLRLKKFRRSLKITHSFKLLVYLYGILPNLAHDRHFIAEIARKSPESVAELPTGSALAISENVNEEFDSEYEERKGHSNTLIRFAFDLCVITGAIGAAVDLHITQQCVNNCSWTAMLSFFSGIMLTGAVLAIGSRLLMKP